MTLKQISAIFALIGLIAGAVFAVDNRYTPREITKFHVADLQKNQMQIQRNIQIQNAQQWLFYWQMQVAQWSAHCARNPYDNNAKAQLSEATRQRNIWQNEVNRLMQQ